jgi:hypothetical protein
LPSGTEADPTRGQAFSATGVGDLRLEWKSNDRLVISYIGDSAFTSLTVLRKQDRLGMLHLEYLPIGWL